MSSVYFVDPPWRFCNVSRMGRAFAILVLAGWTVAAAWAVPPEIVVASYNLESYLGEAPRDDPGAVRTKPKSEAAIAALVKIIQEIHPDILGVCEMGSPEQFATFQQRLAEAGLSFTCAEYVNGPDPDRHLALLSRWPIIARHSQPDVTFDLGGVPQKVRRGFLDVTVRVNDGYELRLLGAHLKSKLPTLDGEALLRRHEAQLLRRQAAQILAGDPATNLLVYGDLNELKNEPAVQEILGARGSAQRLVDLALSDAAGDRWTHYWRAADLYSRIDYFLASPALLREIVAEHSGVYRGPHWNEASDHRPIYTAIVPRNAR